MRPAVAVTLGGTSYRSTIAAMDGVFMIPLSAENREAAGIAAGDELEVELVVDLQPRQTALAEDFIEDLLQGAEARAFFKGLSYSQQRWLV